MTEKGTRQALEQKIKMLEGTVAGLKARLNEHQQIEDTYRGLFRNMLNEVHIWEVVRDEQGTIKTWRLVDANPVALRSWGRCLEDIQGKMADEIFPHSNTTELFLPVVNKIFSEGVPHFWEADFPDTGQILSMVSVAVGERFISTGMDITSIRKDQADLQNSMMKLTEAIEAGNVGLWEWDLLTNAVRYSREWKKQIGYDEHEIRDDFEEWRIRVHPDDLESTLALLNGFLDSDSAKSELRFRFRHKDGSYRWILAHASIYRDDAGKPVRMMGSHIDITRQKELERALLQSQKMEALGTLSSGIAHDFNNLLGPILGYTELAKMKLKPGSKEIEYLDHVEQATIRARELVQKILTISRTSPEKLEPLDLDLLIDEVINVVTASIPKGIVIRRNTDPAMPMVKADSSQLHQLALNICNNAIQAMGENGELAFHLFPVKDADGLPVPVHSIDNPVCLSIRDTGKGMSESVLERAFEPFFTTKTKGSSRGTGLGLSIVADIVKNHNGYIDVESKLGEGTVFRIFLPGSERSPRPATSVKVAREKPAGEHILLVDDEASVCDLGASVLRESGYRVTAFTDCQNAIAHFASRADDFQLVITDYTMPDLSGPQVIEAIRDVRSDVPVLLLTGQLDVLTGENIRSWGCDDVLEKPYRLDALLGKVSGLLQDH